ncbi:MAG TPA: LuxR C-terminal-related transcriptional regulator [Anaerolineaceae bacterium]|jgi:DNA-binding CsgD family transcriptional regulator
MKVQRCALCCPVRLYISGGKVKAHTAAIFRKLDVANRAQAIVKAKDEG